MTNRLWKQLTCWAWIAIAVPVCAQQPKLYTTRTPGFDIPYTLNAATDTITLYISTNLGKRWTVVAQHDAQQTLFRFEAPRDGEYWFCSRLNQPTQNGRPVVPTDLQPELRIYVDTKQPGIDLQTSLTTAGEVVISCQVTDVTVMANQVAAEIQPAPGLPWHPFPLSGPPKQTAKAVVQLDGRWQPPPESRVAMVRIKALDGAGNLSIAERRIFFPPSTLRRPQSYVPLANPYTRPLPHQGAIRWPADTGPPQVGDAPAPAPRANVEEAPVAEAQENSVTAAKPIVNGPAIDAVVHHVNRSRFKLEYSLTTPARDTQQVQLWATEDGGQTWGLWGTDQDRQSPLDVEIQRDGLIGFVTLIGDQDTGNKNQPTSGTNADIWVHVDRVKPMLRLGDVQRSVEAGFPEILIKWEATDDNFSGRPIRLRYSQSQQGPWTEISNSVPNAGFYRWRLDPNATGNWFIQVEAVDRAGNRISAVAAEPLQ
ncbi:MAG: hypothetical protein VX738_00615 [Planctomycetota bacterium]|nr:hypothetical protein [Planctomycetota bacterium]